MDHVEGKDNDKTPCPRGSHVSQEAIDLLDNEEPYIMPFQKKIWREATPPSDDMDLEDTDWLWGQAKAERNEKEFEKKKKLQKRLQVTRSDDLVDYHWLCWLTIVLKTDSELDLGAICS